MSAGLRDRCRTAPARLSGNDTTYGYGSGGVEVLDRADMYGTESAPPTKLEQCRTREEMQGKEQGEQGGAVAEQPTSSRGLLQRAGSGLGELLLRTPLRRRRIIMPDNVHHEGEEYGSPNVGVTNVVTASMLEGSGEFRGVVGASVPWGSPTRRRRRGVAAFDIDDDVDEASPGGGPLGSAIESTLAQLSPGVLKLLAGGEFYWCCGGAVEPDVALVVA